MATIGDYKIIKSLGCGTFAKVKLAKHTKTGEKYAVKIMKRDSDDGSHTDDLFINEVHALTKADHPNILKLADFSAQHSVTTTSNKVVDVNFLALEYAENGEIFNYIAKTGSFAESTARYYFTQLISAIEHINKKGFSHRDIKPENIMLDSKFNLKLADFGFATKSTFSSKRFGTISYMAPEKLSNLMYNTKESDLFSAAVILFIMVLQHCPFNRADPSDKYYSHIILGNFDKFWKAHQNYNGEAIKLSDSFKNLFINMVTVAPESRLTLKEIKSHKWMRGYMPKHQEIYENFSYRKLLLNDEVIDSKLTKGGVLLQDMSNTSMDKNNERKYTRYYRTSHGDHLVDAVIKFATLYGYKHKSSSEYFRVYLKVRSSTKNCVIQVNVLRRPKEQMRCLECIRKKGSYTMFLETFSQLKDFMFKYQKLIEQ